MGVPLAWPFGRFQKKKSWPSHARLHNFDIFQHSFAGDICLPTFIMTSLVSKIGSGEVPQDEL